MPFISDNWISHNTIMIFLNMLGYTVSISDRPTIIILISLTHDNWISHNIPMIFPKHVHTNHLIKQSSKNIYTNNFHIKQLDNP